jgi:hypothetical protein
MRGFAGNNNNNNKLIFIAPKGWFTPLGYTPPQIERPQPKLAVQIIIIIIIII